jgi:hypothetical protein
VTRYFTLSLKTALTRPELIFWAIIFVEFWVLMWAYVFGVYIPAHEEAVKDYVSTAYGGLTILSLSATATTIAYALIHSSKSIKFVTKYTRLSPSRFMVENAVSSITVLLIVSAIMFASMIIVFWHRFGLLVLPHNPPGLFAATLLSAVFLYAFSSFLSLLIVVLRAPRSASFIAFVPLMLGFLAYASLWIDFRVIAYISPFNCISSLFYHYYSGKQPVTGGIFMPGDKELMDTMLTASSLTTWTITLLILDIILLRRMRGVGIEEIRIV